MSSKLKFLSDLIIKQVNLFVHKFSSRSFQLVLLVVAVLGRFVVPRPSAHWLPVGWLLLLLLVLSSVCVLLRLGALVSSVSRSG